MQATGIHNAQFGMNFSSFLVVFFSARQVPCSDATLDYDKKEENDSLLDWNAIMKDVSLDGKPGEDLNAALIKDLLRKHYDGLKDSTV